MILAFHVVVTNYCRNLSMSSIILDAATYYRNPTLKECEDDCRNPTLRKV
jgi:hypothetical protein